MAFQRADKAPHSKAAEIAVLVSTFERPHHLEKCLSSLAGQRGVDGRFEVVVTDDGSRDGTFDFVRSFAGRVSFPVRCTTHPHEGFHLSRCRNEGVRATKAPYLLFTDGDCVLPPDHLAIHLAVRRPGMVIGSDCARLDEAATARLDEQSIRDWTVDEHVPAQEKRRLRRKAMRARVYELLRIPMRPRLTGNNIALWRADFERVNGFDERFVGWGLEDKDLQSRLERAGLRVRSIITRSAPVHLWHQQDPSFSRNNAATANWELYRFGDRPVFCRQGLVNPDRGDRSTTVWPLAGDDETMPGPCDGLAATAAFG
jgi:glycosyltransferase involved in cell wall biosynthesis